MATVVRPRVLASLVLVGLLWNSSLVRAEGPLALRESFPPGYQYHIRCRVELAGAVTLPAEKGQAGPKTLAVEGASAIDYDERVLTLDGQGRANKTARLYRRIDFQRKVGDQTERRTIRPAVCRLVVLRHGHAEVPFSPDGPLSWGEIDLVRTDVFTPALTGLLSDKPVRVGDRWDAAASAVEELTDLDRVEEGRLECRLEQLDTVNGRRYARVGFAGAVRGTNEDGPSRQELDGYLYFDLEARFISYVSLKGTHHLLSKEGKSLGNLTGRFVLTRQVPARCPELIEEALRGMTLEPTDSNSLLLYENEALGVRLLHPRRWRQATVRGQQVAFDEAEGNGLLLTLEAPERVPGAAQFLAESRDWLVRQKANIVRTEPPRRLPSDVGELETFAFEVDLAGQRVLLDYYVLRQRAGGATLAARLLPRDLDKMRKEVERLARSVQLFAPRPPAGGK